MTTPTILITSSLEDIRQRYVESRAEFAKRIGVTEQTYRRMLDGSQATTPATMREVAQRLGIGVHLIAEFMPEPSPARRRALLALVEETNARRSWLVLGEDGRLREDEAAVVDVEAAGGVDT